MPSKPPRRSLRKDTIPSYSSSSAAAVDPTISAYTLNILAKRHAIAELPDILAPESDDESSSAGNGKGQGRKVGGRNKGKGSRIDDLRGRVIKAYDDAHGRPSDRRWAHVVQLLKLSCTQGQYRFVFPQKESKEPSKSDFEYSFWAKQISSLLRSQWTPRSGPDYESDLKNRALTEWTPTEQYPTREAAVVRQILEKREWAADVTTIVRKWFDSSTQDGLTEISVILEKKRILDAMVDDFLDTFIPTVATDADGAKIKDFEKERWIVEITKFVERKGAPVPALLRHATDNLSFNTKQRKSIALREKVKTWQKGVEPDAVAVPEPAPVTKQSSLDFVVSKPSAARLAASKSSAFRNQPQEDDDEDDVIEALPLPSQPSFHSSQIINESTPRQLPRKLPYPVPSPVPSSSTPRSDSNASPNVRVYGRQSGNMAASTSPVLAPVKKRAFPQSPSDSHSRPSKYPRREDEDKDTDMLPPPTPPARSNAIPAAPATPFANARTITSPTLTPMPSPLSPLPAALRTPDVHTNKDKDKPRIPTLTEIISAQNTAAGANGATPNKSGGKKKKINTLMIFPSPLTGKANSGASRGGSVGVSVAVAGERAASVGAGPSRPKATASTQSSVAAAPSESHVLVPDPQLPQKSVLESQFSIATTTSALEQRHHRQRLPSTSFRSRSRSRSSSGTRSPSVQHQPEFTAEGYRIDLPLSVFDGFGTSQSAGNNSLLRLDIGTEDGRGKKKDDTSDDEGTGSGKKKKEKKKRGYFGMEDIDLKSPTKLKPGVVRPFAESEEEDDEEGSDQEEVREMDMAGGPSTSPITPQPKKIHSAHSGRSRSHVPVAFESRLPDFTLDEDAFDPQRISTQRRSAGPSGSGGNDHQYGYGYNDGDDGSNNGEGDGDGTSSYGAPPIFNKDGTINIRSLEDDLTSKAFYIPGLDSPTKKGKRGTRGGGGGGGGWGSPFDDNENENEYGGGNGDGSQSQSQFQSQALEGFGYGYCSQMDVEGAADRVSRFVDGDVSS